jgi:DNA polymerase III sliding clamp (beta) subunit (PCNA family)
MKFSINKTECINLLKPLLGIVDNTNPNINFSCFKIITKNKEIVAQACNSLIVCQNKTTNATIEKDGEILIKANLLFDIVSRSSVGSLNFDKVEENVLRISQNAKCFNDINLFELVQFPVLSFVKKETNQMVLPFKTLKEINDKIIPIIQNNQQYNNVYNGISIDSETEKSLIELLGTDTHRLVVLKKDFIGESIKFILPTEVFRAIYSSNTEKD